MEKVLALLLVLGMMATVFVGCKSNRRNNSNSDVSSGSSVSDKGNNSGNGGVSSTGSMTQSEIDAIYSEIWDGIDIGIETNSKNSSTTSKNSSTSSKNSSTSSKNSSTSSKTSSTISSSSTVVVPTYEFVDAKTGTWKQDSKGWYFVNSKGQKLKNKMIKNCSTDTTKYQNGLCYVGSDGYKVVSDEVGYGDYRYEIDADGFVKNVWSEWKPIPNPY